MPLRAEPADARAAQLCVRSGRLLTAVCTHVRRDLRSGRHRPDRAIAAFLQTTHRIPNDEWAMTNVLRRDNAYELISTTQVRDQGISREERVVYDNQRQKMLLACADELHTV